VDAPERLRNLLDCLNAIAQRYDKPLVVSTHPRTRKRLEAQGDAVQLDARVRLLKPLGLLDYVKLQQQAFCVVSDSGTITEECAILDFPAITIREAHERPEGMDEATVVMSGLNPDRVLQAIDVVTAHRAADGRRSFRLPPDYESLDVSRKVVRIILSYTDFVNRNVWKK
jgi:UDP-N-acetylglucosamine 2-epimerase (non-hydrolysing)